MSAARRRRVKPQKRIPNLGRLPWPEWVALVLIAAAASAWSWRGGPALTPWSKLAAGMLGILGPAVALAWAAPPRERRLGLGLIALGVLLSRVGSIGSPYLLPWGVTAGLAALFQSKSTAMLLLLPLLGWAGPLVEGNPLLSALLGGVTMALFAEQVRRGRDLLLSGVLAGVAGGLGAFALWPWSGVFGVGAAFLSGLSSAVIVWTLLPFVERTVDRTSRLTLAELLSPSHPLLERLRAEAPGTYYHARDVSALSEAGARAVGADPLLAAVGGLYHDIGKLLRPQFFGENQNGTNPHDELPPSMSKVILASHVKDGVELGRHYGLRGDVLKFVATHHGTTVMRSLSQRGAGQGLTEDEFRYDSPLPDTNETAVVMLADSVEAYSRGRDREDLAEVVDQVIEDRRRDGQLDRAPLTMADLAQLRRAFTEALQGMAHRRVQGYPLPR